MIAMAVKGYLKTQLAQIIQHLVIGLGLTIVIATILLS
jgi:hypothetical protein